MSGVSIESGVVEAKLAADELPRGLVKADNRGIIARAAWARKRREISQ